VVFRGEKDAEVVREAGWQSSRPIHLGEWAIVSVAYFTLPAKVMTTIRREMVEKRGVAV
jgi:lysylphosphatidylglycerol synthetase-like protein (DUF2156 family)